MNFLRVNNFTELRLSSLRPSELKVDAKSVALASAAALGGLGVLYLGKIWYSYGYFKKRGIKTPKYSFIFGNFKEIVEHNYSDTLNKWSKEFGSLYGYYEGHRPIMVTSDLDIIHEVFYKEYFTNFSARKMMIPLQYSDNQVFNMVFSAKNKWKRMRNIINPTFSPAKLKELVPLLKKCSDRFLELVENNLDKEINVTDHLGRMTMDAVFNCFFGIDEDIQHHPDNIYLTKTRSLVASVSRLSPAFYFFIIFYELRPLFALFSNLMASLFFSLNTTIGSPVVWLPKKLNEIIKKRVDSSTHRRDYIQILLDSQAEAVSAESDKQTDTSLVEKKLTLEEIRLNLVGFLVAGYETTATTTANCLFTLANHPDEITKLQEEIDANIDTLDDLDYDRVNQLEYLDLFIKEVLRMNPVGNNFINRRCVKSTVIKGVEIPEGQAIVIDVFGLHFNPEYWGSVDPNEFYPSRFLEPNINKQAFVPFGLGPRQCIGMRFALLEIKLTLIKLLKRYTVERGPNTPQKIQFVESIVVRVPKEPIKLVFKKRAD